MSQAKETILLFLSFLITSAIIGAGVFWFFNRNQTPSIPQVSLPSPTPAASVPSPTAVPSPPTTPTSELSFQLPSNVAPGTTVRINGSTSMVQINELLRQGFTQQFPGTQVIANASGTEKGIEDLLNGRVDIAAISRPLSSAEQQQGLVAIPVAKDQIAVVVGVGNPFSGSLTQAQVRDIFQGKLINWSQLGGNNSNIRVINRPPISGTYQAFQDMALAGGNFGNTPNITTMERDATTPILRALGNDGISYATFSQVANQSTVRVLSIENTYPGTGDYPYQRTLYYVYRQPANPAVEAFLGYLQSPQGQANF